jgi:S1-C subfamily serine protease
MQTFASSRHTRCEKTVNLNHLSVAFWLSLLIAAPTQAADRAFEDVVDQMRGSVVHFEAVWFKDRKTNRQSLGSGFIVNRDGYVVSAAHVIAAGQRLLSSLEGAERAAIRIYLAMQNIQREAGAVHLDMRGSFVGYGFSISGVDELNDVILLKLDKNPFIDTDQRHRIGDFDVSPKPVPAMLYTSRPRDGAAIAMSGYPLGQPVLITTSGRLASGWAFDTATIGRDGAPAWLDFPRSRHFYFADMTTNPGNSGAPVYLATTGSVIGICTAVLNAPVRTSTGGRAAVGDDPLVFSSGITFVIPSQIIVSLLEKHGATWNEAK